MKILLTNDDGYSARGLKELARMLAPMGELTVIAPKYHQSGVAIAVTMGFKPIAVKELGSDGDGVRWIYLDGSPASCVKFAIDNVFTDGKPDLVVSGINHGLNAATAACYSATLGAAQEAAINGIPAIGVSIDSPSEDADFSAVRALLPDIIRRLAASGANTFGLYYNVNFPDLPLERIKGVRVGHMGIGHWEKEFEDWDAEAFARRGIDLAKYNVSPTVDLEPGEEVYVMLGRFVDDARNTEGADHHLVAQGYVSIVAHNFDNTDRKACECLRGEGFDQDFQ